MNPYYATAEDIRDRLATIIPVWYPEDLAEESAAALLAQTLADVERVSRPEHVALVVDGQPRWAGVARAAAERLAEGERRPNVILRPENQGKGAAVAAGMERALAETECDRFVARDADGDHFTNDLPSLFRLLLQIVGETGNECALVVGARADRRRPMGLVRGELERWTADFVWNAARFALAARGEAPDETFMGPYDHIPDLLSGYKLYTRVAARIATDGMARAMAEHPELNMGRYGGEIAPHVEVLMAGGVVGQMIRGTMEGQPVSGFASLKRLEVYPCRLLWVSRRLGLSGDVALRLFDNAVARSPLSSEADLYTEFAHMRARLAEGLGVDPAPPTRSAYC